MDLIYDFSNFTLLWCLEIETYDLTAASEKLGSFVKFENAILRANQKELVQLPDQIEGYNLLFD